MAAVLVGILTRLGVLACIVVVSSRRGNMSRSPPKSNSWYFASSVMTMALFAAVAVYGFVVSLGGRIGIMDPALDSSAPRAGGHSEMFDVAISAAALTKPRDRRSDAMFHATRRNAST